MVFFADAGGMCAKKTVDVIAVDTITTLSPSPGVSDGTRIAFPSFQRDPKYKELIPSDIMCTAMCRSLFALILGGFSGDAGAATGATQPAWRQGWQCRRCGFRAGHQCSAR